MAIISPLPLDRTLAPIGTWNPSNTIPYSSSIDPRAANYRPPASGPANIINPYGNPVYQQPQPTQDVLGASPSGPGVPGDSRQRQLEKIGESGALNPSEREELERYRREFKFGGLEARLELELNEDIKKFQEQILSLENQIADINHEIEEKSEIQQISLQKDISDLKDFISHNSARIESLEKEITRVDERKNQLKINISELDKKISSLQKTKSDLQNKSQNLEKQKVKIQERIDLISQKDIDEKLEKEIDKCIDNDSLLAGQLSDIHSRYSLLQQKIAVARARQDSVNEINFSTKGVEEILKLRMRGVYGTVSSLIKADEKFSLALETAAGPRINAIIVENEEVAAKGINHLKKNK